ncbi:MAG: hypothetical protein M3Z24_13535, partial [Chloroflexota bacterium]|nr:hypothetical protein [Chloroflexota bacterium]
FGIDHERSLEALFRDALGVRQGSFTSIFTDHPAKRKQTFNTLLQIEDYDTAFKYLLEAQNAYKEQMITQQSEIQRLTFETHELENWRTDLDNKQQEYHQKTEQITQYTARLEVAEQRETVLRQQQEALSQAEQRYRQSKDKLESNQKRLADRELELKNARLAQEAVEVSREDYQRYQETNELLDKLRKDEKQRAILREQHASHSKTRATLQTHIANLQTRLAEVETARQHIIELSPLVDQQSELERQREELTYKEKEYNALMDEGKSLSKQQKDHSKKQEAIKQSIVTIEPLQAAAALLNERVEVLANLRAQGNERTDKNRQLQEKKEQLRQKLGEREKFADRLRKNELKIATIEEHRAEAETLPALKQQHDQLSEQRYRLEGNIEGYRASRQQSVGGQCPFLQEPCLNIKQRGVISLESYFDGLLKKDHVRLTGICQQLDTLSTTISSRKKYADALDTLGHYVLQRDNEAEHLHHLAIEIARLEREVDELTQELEALKKLPAQIVAAEAAMNESQKASSEVNTLTGLRMQVEQLQEAIDRLEESLQERRAREKELRGSREQLDNVKQTLEVLNDPRGMTRAHHLTIQQEPLYQKNIQAEQQKLQTTDEQLQVLDQQLSAYEHLDRHIGQQENQLQQSLKGYQTYLSNEQNARLLPQRQQAYQDVLGETEQSQERVQEAEHVYIKAQETFNVEELGTVVAEMKRLRNELTTLIETIRHIQGDITLLEKSIQHAEVLLAALEKGQKEYATLDELQTMMEQFRKYIKESAPYVLKAMLGDISAEANRIFGEIMGDRSGQLMWQDDYEIRLRRQGVNRTFAQLSGGEQMSAALAVRLALLKKLSTLNIAFFDEPTQNMDELRRMNLAEQIRRVRGFDQLIVISHDDTFEQGLDSLVRLRKVDG